MFVLLTTIVAQAQEDGFKSPSLLHNKGMQSAGARAGHDTWKADVPKNGTTKGLCYGANTGVEFDFYPKSFLCFTVKAQQYMLFSKAENYFKPTFTAGVRYVWNN